MEPAAPATSKEVRALYAARLSERRASAERAARRARWLSNARLAVFLLAVALAWPVFVSETLAKLWLVPVGAGFAALVLRHEAARRACDRAERGAEFYARGIARLELSDDAPWGNTGECYSDPHHPYAEQLDLFGPGSLYALLSQAQTAGGQARLAEWLLAPAEPAEIRARQAAAAELAPRLALREDLFALGPEAREGLRPEALVAWATAPRRLGGPLLRIALALLVTPRGSASWRSSRSCSAGSRTSASPPRGSWRCAPRSTARALRRRGASRSCAGSCRCWTGAATSCLR